jgi:N-acetylmuramoyl-L-alanine amidase
MIFLSAGHNSQSESIKRDPGAVNKFGVREGDLTIEFRDLVSKELTCMGIKHITDLKEENLQMYLNRIKTGTGSMVIEYHFDAGPETATGCTSLVEEDADRLDKACATELAAVTSNMLGIRNRGVKPESWTRHGRLALMREEGIICLFEIGFITNQEDLAKYHINKLMLAKAHAAILAKYEAMIP